MGVRLMSLVASAHPGPSLAVTALAALLAVALGGGGTQVGGIIVAVLSGQLVIGWSNDLIDADRDRLDARTDKPLAAGALTTGSVVLALSIAGVTTATTSLLLGWLPGLLHLGLVVGSGVAYNVGVKATLWSFVPYALAFGALPAVVWYAVRGGLSTAAPSDLPNAVAAGGPPIWMVTVGALLGVGAHLLNALPDLPQDRSHGIHGLPHRLGARGVQRLAPALLVAGVLITAVMPAGPVTWWGWTVLAGSAALAAVAGRSTGKTPFRAAVGVALLAATALVTSAW